MCVSIGIFSVFLCVSNFVDAAGTGNITGIVTDSASGAPLVGVSVVCLSQAGKSATTGADGSYTITGLNVGTQGFRYTYTGYNTAQHGISIVANQTTTANEALVLTPPPTYGNIEGTITDTDTGSPVSSATVVINGTTPATLTTDVNGYYSTTSLRTGSYTVQISKSRYTTSSKLPATISDGATSTVNSTLTALPPLTVCDSGCGYTTITAAVATAVVGSEITVNAPYSTGSESFPLNFGGVSLSSLTIQCTGGAIIGSTSESQVTINVYSTTTIQNCSFSNVKITHTSSTYTGIQILNNTFSTSTRSEIVMGYDGFIGALINGNTGLSYIYISQGSANTIQNNVMNIYTASTYNGIRTGSNSDTIQGNEINIYTSSTNNGITLNSDSNNSPSGLTVSNNIVRSHSASLSGTLIGGNESRPANTTISSNTLEYVVAPTSGGVSAIRVSDGIGNTISNNKISIPTGTGNGCYGINVVGDFQSGGYTITHNTIKLGANCTGITVGWNSHGATALTTDIQYNIITNTSSTAQGTGLEYTKSGDIDTLTNTNNYNGFYNLTTNLSNSNSGQSYTTGAGSVIGNPIFRSTSSYELAPFSSFLDVNGETDIGSISGTRENIINIDDDGTIDWSSVHATSTSILSTGILRDGQTINLAAGTYDAITLPTSSVFTGNVTISGAGSNTVVQAGASSSAITLDGIQGATIKNLVVQNASTTQTSYTVDVHAYTYNSVDYSTIYSGSVITGMYMAYGTEISSGPQQLLSVSANTDISNYVGSTPQNWHLALDRCTPFGANPAIYFRNDIFPTRASAESYWVNVGCPAFDYWATSTLEYADGSYVFHDPEGMSTEPTHSGVSSNITRRDNSFAGIKLNNSSNVFIEHVTSTHNGYGLWFTGTSADTVVSSSVFTGNLLYDLVSDGTGTNSFKDVSFTTASSSISNSGQVNVYYRLRGLVQTLEGEPISGVSVNLVPYDGSFTSELLSGDSGYTPYSAYLWTLIMNNSRPTGQATGLNPFSLVALAHDVYGEKTVTTTLNEVQKTITINMPLAGATPSSSVQVTLATVGATSSFQLAVAGTHEIKLDSLAGTTVGITISSNNPTPLALSGIGDSDTANGVHVTLTGVTETSATFTLADVAVVTIGVGGVSNGIISNQPTILFPAADQILSELPFKILGSASPRNKVYVYIGGMTYTVDASETGHFEASILHQLIPGAYTISAYQEDGFGNKSASFERKFFYQKDTPVTVDTTIATSTAPTLKIVSSTEIQEQPEKILEGTSGNAIRHGVHEIVSPTTNDVQEISQNLESQLTAFILFQRKNTAEFFRDQVSTINIIPGENIEILMRPDQPVHNIIARLYEVDASESEKFSVLDSIWAWFGSVVYAQQPSEKLVGTYLFEHMSDIDAYRGIITAPSRSNRSYKLLVTIIGQDGSRVNITKDIAAIEPGYVYHHDKNRMENRIVKAQIAIYHQDADGSFNLWNASEYGQKNPLFTDDEGGYSISVPAGSYYMKVSAAKHSEFQSKILTYGNLTIIKNDIELTQRQITLWEQMWDWLIRLFS